MKQCHIIKALTVAYFPFLVKCILGYDKLVSLEVATPRAVARRQADKLIICFQGCHGRKSKCRWMRWFFVILLCSFSWIFIGDTCIVDSIDKWWFNEFRSTVCITILSYRFDTNYLAISTKEFHVAWYTFKGSQIKLCSSILFGAICKKYMMLSQFIIKVWNKSLHPIKMGLFQIVKYTKIPYIKCATQKLMQNNW